MPVTASFSSGVLTLTGDALANGVLVSSDTSGNLLINSGAVTVLGGPATLATTTLIRGFGLGGNDTLSVNEANGALPGFLFYGGGGNDSLGGGSGSDTFYGQGGGDTLLGRGGQDYLAGGAGNDILVGGTGSDQVFGQSGNDRMIWSSGDGNDSFNGGNDTDTAEINYSTAAETITVTAIGSVVHVERVTPGASFIDITNTETTVINASGGDDSISCSGGLGALTSLTIDAGAGGDTVNGGNGSDLIIGGDGNDVVDGNQGNDVVLLGANDDVFQWDPGDGSDTVEGQAGTDTFNFNGANISENINIFANGSRVQFLRDIATVTMDLNGMEQLNCKALGGSDAINVHDLSGTGVQSVAIDLSASFGGGDGAPDTVSIDGTAADDLLTFSIAGGVLTVSGLPWSMTITGFETADRIVVNGLAGEDVIDAAGLAGIQVTLNGGEGDDVLIGTAGFETLLGADGDDIIIGNGGGDTIDPGTGDNLVI